MPSSASNYTLIYNSVTVDTETVTVSGNGDYTTPTVYSQPTATTVTYTHSLHDALPIYTTNNNNASDVGATNERVTVSPASPMINTIPDVTSVTLGKIGRAHV